MKRSTVGGCFQKENKGKQRVEDINFHDCCLCYFASFSFTLLGLKIQNSMKQISFQGQLCFENPWEKKMRIKARLSRKFPFPPSVFIFASQHVYMSLSWWVPLQTTSHEIQRPREKILKRRQSRERNKLTFECIFQSVLLLNFFCIFFLSWQ